MGVGEHVQRQDQQGLRGDIRWPGHLQRLFIPRLQLVLVFVHVMLSVCLDILAQSLLCPLHVVCALCLVCALQ